MKRITYFLIVAAVFIAAGCGGGGTEAEEAPTISTIDQLPNATGPMATASASVSRGLKAATTGLNIVGTAEGDFTSANSMGACQTFNNVREGILSAAQADQILCYVKQMQDAFGTGTGVDVYDGAWHIFNLNIVDCTTDADCVEFEGEGATCNANGKCEVNGTVVGSPSRVKMQIARDATTGSITSFEMFMCGGALTQQEYTKQTISGSTVTMSAVGNFTSSDGSGWHSVDVTGTLNASGAYTTKTITLANNGSFGGEGNTNWQEGTLTQGPGTFILSGYQSGSWSSQGSTGTYTDIAYGTGQMLGDTTGDIRNMAMGDGAVKYSTTVTDSAYPTPWTSSGVDPWLGDGGLPDPAGSGNAYYGTANDETLRSAEESIISIGFAAAETWGCDDDVGVGIVDLPSASQSEMQTACAQFGSMSHDWINCYAQIEGGGD